MFTSMHASNPSIHVLNTTIKKSSWPDKTTSDVCDCELWKIKITKAAAMTPDQS